MLAGRKPFAARSEPAMIYALLNTDPEPLAELREDVPGELAAVIHRALARDPGERFADGAELLDAVEALEPQRRETVLVPDRQVPLAMPGSLLRRPMVGAFAAIVLVALAVAVVPRLRGGAEDRVVDALPMVRSEDVLAVLPFTVRGSPDLEYLGEGIVDLISDKLDGAGTIQSIDPRSVIGTARSRDVDVSDPEAAAALASSLGAGRFVTGEVLGSGGRLSISATLWDPAAASAPLETASVEGSAEELFRLIDEVAASLLAGSLSGPGARLQAIATRTSSSIDATKEFLRGEQLHRAGQYRDASAAYNRAIELDSTFALAHYKKSYVNDYTDEPDDYLAADAAFRFSGDLSERDQTLVRALREQRSGRRRAAEQIYRTHVLRYPDEVGALMQLGEILFHDNPRRGRPMEESREWFERVTDVEPGNIEANLHLARLDAVGGRVEDVLRRAEFFNEVVPGSERSIEVEAAYAFLANDTARQRAAIDRLQGTPWYFWAYAAWGAAQFARNPHAGLEIVGTYPSRVDYLESLEIRLRLVTGQRDSAMARLTDEGRARTPSWDTYESFVHASGLIPLDTARVEWLIGRLQAADPVALKMSAFVPLHDIITPEVTEVERDWHVAQLLGLIGRFDEAWQIQRRLEAMDDLPQTGTLKKDAAAALEAELLYRSGDAQAALDVLRALEYDLPGAVLWLSFADGTRARFLRAELEMEMGDPAVAKPFYEGFHGSYSPTDGFYATVAYERLGRIAELEGDLDAAIFHYDKLIEAWRDAKGGEERSVPLGVPR
jgi:tetratricopeptide (TPR) repeat protein